MIKVPSDTEFDDYLDSKDFDSSVFQQKNQDDADGPEVSSCGNDVDEFEDDGDDSKDNDNDNEDGEANDVDIESVGEEIKFDMAIGDTGNIIDVDDIDEEERKGDVDEMLDDDDSQSDQFFSVNNIG